MELRAVSHQGHIYVNWTSNCYLKIDDDTIYRLYKQNFAATDRQDASMNLMQSQTLIMSSRHK
jgi:hypothetical protein